MKRIVAVIALAFAAACTAKAGGEQIEKKIVEIYAGQGLTITKVTCPKSIEVKVGTKFTCDATFDNGETFKVEGTISSKDKSEFQYGVAIPEANYISAKLEKAITDGITEQRSAPKSVTCGKPGLHHPPASGELECTAVDQGDVAHKVKFTFDAAGAPQNWEVVD